MREDPLSHTGIAKAGVVVVQSNPFPLCLKISFSWEILDKYGTLFLLFNKSILLPVNACNQQLSVDPNQTRHSMTSGLGLHCLLRPVSSNTQSKYGNIIKLNPLRNPPGSAPTWTTL